MNEPSYHILFIDMDKMKDINDDYGHDIGDNALKEASRILRTSFREGDIISRYGGDEFIVFVSSIKDDVVENIKDRIESSTRKFNENDNSKYKLGLTIGHAKYSSDEKESLQQVINRADKDMYLNKMEADR